MVSTNFQDGRTLFAANLNTEFARTVDKSGDNVTGLFSINNIEIGTGLIQAKTNANSALNLVREAFTDVNAAFALANSNQNLVGGVYTLANSTTNLVGGAYTAANSALNLSQSAFAAANSANSIVGGNGVSSLTLIANTSRPGLTVNNGVTITLSSNGTIVFGANTGNLTQVGVVQLHDTVLSTSTVLGSTANAVNTVWATAQAVYTLSNSNFNQIGSAFPIANSALNLSISAFAKANSVVAQQLTFFSSNGLTTNSVTELTVAGNNTVFLSANLGNTTQIGLVRLNDTFTSTFANQAATTNVANTIWTSTQAISALANSNQNLVAAAFDRANSGGAAGGIQTILTSNGITVNTGTSISVTGNNTVAFSANIGNTTQPGIVQLNDTFTSVLATQATTTNVANTIWTTTKAVYLLTNSTTNLVTGAYALANSDANLVGGAYTIANSALNLSQSAFDRANSGGSAGGTQNILTANGITVNSGTFISVTGNNTIVLSANLGNTTKAGIVQLNDTVLSTSVTLGSTANAVNTAWATAQGAFIRTNSTTNLVTGAYANANAALAQANGFQSVINSAFALANSTTNLVVGAYANANAALAEANAFQSIINSAFALANSNQNLVAGSYNLANSDANLIASDYALTNSTTNLVTGAYANANAAFAEANGFQAVINSSYALTNSTTNLVTSVFNLTNNQTILISSTQNLVGGAYNLANSAADLSQSAFNKANIGGGVISQTIMTANGITVNSGTTITVSGNNTIVLSANLGNTTKVGIIQLNDTVISTSVTLGATANAVNTVWATANAAFIRANTGGVTFNDTVTSTLTNQAATPNAVNTVWTTAQASFLRANSAQNLIASAYALVNNHTALISSVQNLVAGSYNLANSDANLVASVYALANGHTNLIASAFNQANTVTSPTIPTTIQLTSFTLSLANAGTLTEVNSASNVFVTIPNNGAVAFLNNTVIEVCQTGAGSVRFANGTGVTVFWPASNTTRTLWSTLAARKRSANVWVISGDAM